MCNLDDKLKVFACFYLFTRTKMTNVDPKIYLQSEIKRKYLGDIKCVEVTFFCIKEEKNKTSELKK